MTTIIDKEKLRETFDRQNAINAVNKFIATGQELADNWHEVLNAGYPLNESFDETVLRLIEWRDAVSGKNEKRSLLRSTTRGWISIKIDGTMGWNQSREFASVFENYEELGKCVMAYPFEKRERIQALPYDMSQLGPNEKYLEEYCKYPDEVVRPIPQGDEPQSDEQVGDVYVVGEISDEEVGAVRQVVRELQLEAKAEDYALDGITVTESTQSDAAAALAAVFDEDCPICKAMGPPKPLAGQISLRYVRRVDDNYEISTRKDADCVGVYETDEHGQPQHVLDLPLGLQIEQLEEELPRQWGEMSNMQV